MGGCGGDSAVIAAAVRAEDTRGDAASHPIDAAAHQCAQHRAALLCTSHIRDLTHRHSVLHTPSFAAGEVGDFFLGLYTAISCYLRLYLLISTDKGTTTWHGEHFEESNRCRQSLS